MNKQLPIDLLIFDFDGTLTDSIPGAIESIQEMLAEQGYPPKSAAEINQHVGFGELPLVAGAIGSSNPVLVKAAQASYYRHYAEKGYKKATLYPQVLDFLELFKGKKMIIISNKRDEFIKMILAKYELLEYFTEIHGGDTAPCLKPDPCVIISEMKKYQTEPNRTLFIGDMTIDIATGKNAHTLTCAVTYGFDSREKLAAANPDFLIDNLLDLKGIIK